MKKLVSFVLGFFALSFLGLSFVDASGCFHDALTKDAHYEVITSGVRVRTVSCMYGSDVITTLGAGTVVRVIAYNPYWKQIEMADGRAGWIGANFATRTNQTANIPCSGMTPGDYCHTLNRSLCPNPSLKGVEPTRYTRAEPQPYNCSLPNQTSSTEGENPTVHPTTPHVIPVNDSMKSKLDMMANRVNSKIDAKYQDNIDGKIAHYQALISALNGIKSSAVPLSQLIDYLVSKFEETLSLLQVQNVLDI